ncbi:hypothetical protein [Massilia glaciei]|uniref:Uncharacterized protein n=1 Tax=Massilia glaciei TaxID=1524097 RepID=A0A2U2HPA4_9BURK|nr:hypothetical protein [Massilia glaciei]PWF49354.1 hypothetical protein C7C56_006930 [Massilia glaciei]
MSNMQQSSWRNEQSGNADAWDCGIAPRRAHSTPDPDAIPPREPPPSPLPDDVPPPANAPVEEPRMPEPPIRAAAA